MIKYLESKGINVNKKDKTALEIAKEQNNAEVIKYLESKGIDVNKKDKTAYDVAKEQVVIEYLKYLRGITNNFEEAKEILKMLESVNDSIKK